MRGILNLFPQAGCFVILLSLFSSMAFAGQGDPAWPILHHEIRAEMQPARSWLKVSDRIGLASPDDAQKSFHFLLNENLEVDSIEFQGTPLSFEAREGFQPRDFWRRPAYSELDAYGIVRQYTVQAPAGGWNSEPLLEISYSGVVMDSLKAPEVAYSRGFETTSGLITEPGAYLSSATFWLPWNSEEAFTFRLETHLPGGWESMSTGDRILRESDPEGVSRVVWSQKMPFAEVYFIAGPYIVRERMHGEVRLCTYTYASTPEDLCESYLDATAEYLDLYSGRYGPYPFSSFALVENWWQTGYGMPGFTLLGDKVIRLPFIIHTSYGHEILHNWWGNGVYVDYSQGNWCEGLTTYGADYFYKERESAAAARDYRLNQLTGYLDHATGGGKDFALRDFREREGFSTQAVGYGKSLMVYHMLRQRVGDDHFNGSLKLFYNKNRFQEAGWNDLRESFEKHCQLDLKDWFAQWLDRPGAIQLELGEITAGKDSYAVQILQKEPVYDCTVELHYADDEGEHILPVQMGGESATVEIPLSARSIAVDPEYQLFRRLHRQEIPPTLSQTLGADSTLVVIGSGCDEALRQACMEVARSWAPNQNMKIIQESELNAQASAGRSLYLLGPGEEASRALELAACYGDLPQDLHERTRTEAQSLIYCVRDPADENLSWTVVLPSSAEVAAALGRKIPHYGRYSYLTFASEQVQEKGAWVVEASPLRRNLGEGS